MPLTTQPSGAKLSPEQIGQIQPYAQLLDAGYGALKGVSRSNVVIGGNSWSVCDIRPIDWVHYMKLPNGKRPRMDLYGHNPYIVQPRSTPLDPKLHIVQINQLPALEKALKKYFKRPIGLFLSEFSIPSAPDRQFAYNTTEAGQARIATQALKISRKDHLVKLLGWAFLRDDPPKAGETSGNSGGLERVDGSHKPAYDAFKNG
jgi:hypothetical protein